MISTEVTHMECPICLVNLEKTETSIPTCHDPAHTSHPDCIKHYVQNTIDSAFPGYCPSIKCPCFHKKGSHPILNYNLWSPLVDASHLEKYNQFAGSTLGFLCGGCHTLRSLQVETNPTLAIVAKEYLRQLLSTSETSEATKTEPEQFAILFQNLTQFELGSLDVQSMYSHLLTLFPQLFSMEERPAWEIFKYILQLISNPERRNMLHLRHINVRPRIFTPCCSREHCYRCRTRDFHTGQTCEQNTNALDSSFLPCPGCGVMLTKGDGCNSVTCVCKRVFSWTEEKQWFELSNKFSVSYPSNTAWSCAQVLCQEIVGINREAEAWSRKNSHLANQALRTLWLNKFKMGASQCCVVSNIRTKNPGLKMAAELWEATNRSLVERSKSQIIIAKDSYFATMHPSASFSPLQQAEAAVKILSDFAIRKLDERLHTSAVSWTQNHQELVTVAKRDIRFRSAMQFLHSFGQLHLKQTPKITPNTYPTSWNRDISNTSLEFGEDNQTVKRPGSVSSFPASFANLTGPRCRFSVEIVECDTSMNYISFGVSKGAFPNQSSDGVGPTANSWGFYDQRSDDVTPLKVFDNRVEITTCRKICARDILMAEIDTSEGWLEISLLGKNQDFQHRFLIPCGDHEDYKFTMTFANNHKARIVQPPEDGNPFVEGQTGKRHDSVPLNNQHLISLSHLRALLKALGSCSGHKPPCEDQALLSIVPPWGWNSLEKLAEEWRGFAKRRFEAKFLTLGSTERREEREDRNPLGQWVLKLEGNKEEEVWKKTISRKNLRKEKKRNSLTPTPPSPRDEERDDVTDSWEDLLLLPAPPPRIVPISVPLPPIREEDLVSYTRHYLSARPGLMEFMGVNKSNSATSWKSKLSQHPPQDDWMNLSWKEVIGVVVFNLRPSIPPSPLPIRKETEVPYSKGKKNKQKKNNSQNRDRWR